MKRLFLLLTLVCSTFLYGCGKEDNLYLSKNLKDYKKIESVEGVSFQVPSSHSSQTTAITEISSDSQLEYDEAYCYKDGKSTYMMFKMSTYVIIASNDVHYDIESFDKTAIVEGLSSYYMLGLRLSPDSDIKYDTSSKNGVTKFIADVTAEFILDTEFYNSFRGKIAYIKDGENQWAIFMGLADSLYDRVNEESLEAIDNVTKSFCQTGKIENSSSSVGATEIYPDMDFSDSEIQDDNLDQEDSLNNNEEENEKEDDLPQLEDTDRPPMTDVPKEDIYSSEDSIKPTEPPKEEETPSQEPSTEEGIEISNQIVNNTSGTRISNIYSMLLLGQSGYASVIDSMTQEVKTITVTAEEIYTGEKAIQLIMDYCDSEEAPYEYSDASEGTTWHVLKYSVDYKGIEVTDHYLPYVNVKILGLDGENLTVRGISYSKKTHDIKNCLILQGTECKNCYVFYEVPNGCSEYLLEIGNGNIYLQEQGILAAYFRIKF